MSASSCRDSSRQSQRNDVEDALGRLVSVPLSPQRIVSLAPSATETIFAAGAHVQLVAVSAVDNYPPDVDSLAKITVFPAVDYERLVALQPDLVFASTDVQGPDLADRLSDFGIPVFFLDGSTLDDIFNNVRLVGSLAQTNEKADAHADLLVSSVEQMRQLVSESGGDSSKVLVLVGDRELYSFGGDSYINEMVAIAGGKSISAEVDMEAPVLSDEFVLAEQPDVIILAQGDDYDPGRLLENHPSWRVLPAVEHGRVFSMDPDLLLRPGPRVVDGILQMTLFISPELFSTSGAIIAE